MIHKHILSLVIVVVKELLICQGWNKNPGIKSGIYLYHVGCYMNQVIFQ